MNTGLLAKAGATISRVGGRTLLKVRKYSPEFMLGFGVVGLVGATYIIAKSDTKAKEVKEMFDANMDVIADAKAVTEGKTTEDGEEVYSREDEQRDKATVYVQTGMAYLKVYGPAVGLGIASLACIFGSHHIMQQRNIAIAAAYRIVKQAFDQYRARVLEEKDGELKDIYYRHGVKPETIKVKVENEDGKTSTVTRKVVDADRIYEASPYAKFFDEYSRYWQKNPDLNRAFLQIRQNTLNDRLNATGHIFLNEVYDELGIPRTTEGQIVGWIKDGDGDGYIDFGIFHEDKEMNRLFVNGYTDRILLDFNVDGLIWEMI